MTTYFAGTEALRDPVLFEELYRQQPEYRRRKIDSYLLPKDKMLSLGAGVLLQHVLDEHGIIHKEPICGPNGKPAIPGICFNLSHSGNRVMCAVSDTDVGCDVEEVTDIELEIARRFFFGSEYADICSSNDPEYRIDRFFRFWTLKESFMKATGLGFELPLDSFSITIGDRISVKQTVDDREYHFQEFLIEEGYRYSCCSTDPEIKKNMVQILI